MTAATQARCAADGCNRFAGAGGFCRSHSRAVDIDSSADDRAQRRALFQERLAAGDYRQLLGPELNSIIRQAATENSVDEEIGALRYAMKVVLATETDPVRLAQAISKLGAASISAARARRLLAGGTADALTDAITNILLELEP